MKKNHIVFFVFLFTALQLHADPNRPEKKIPRGIDRSVSVKVKERIKLVSASDVEPRSEAVRPNAEIVKRIRKRGLTTQARRKNSIAFYTSEDEKITDLDGKQSGKRASINDLRKINHCFLISQVEENGQFPDDGYQNQIAHEWWKKNQSINYMPLRVSLVKYYKVNNDTTTEKDNQTFFAVAPIFEGISSQIVTFGFEKEFFFNNTSSRISSIALTVNGNEYVISNQGTVEVGFFEKGDYTIPVRVTTQDGVTYFSAFTFSVQPLIDGTWSNSKINEEDDLDFIY